MGRLAYHIPILGYHRIGVARLDHVPTVSAAAFERQLLLLAKWRYQVLSFGAMVSRLEHSLPMPRRSTVITFDDGYEETYTLAWPLLKRFGFPAIVFVTPAEVATPGFATWQQLAEMLKSGFAIGSHTMHHTYLTKAAEGRFEEEIAGSKRVIEERLGRPVDFLSYPIGGYTSRAQEVARAAGYRAACTTNRGVSYAMVDRFAIRRIKATERDAQPLFFAVKMSGYYDMFRRLKPPS